jgi:stage III sporulation protein AF
MVSWMSDWLKQIVLLVLIATFIDLLLPNNRLDRYVKLVMGLLIILAMLSPVFQLLSEDHDLRSFAFLGSSPALSKEVSMEEIKKQGEALKQEQQQWIRQEAEARAGEQLKDELQQRFQAKVEKAEVKLKMDGNEQAIEGILVVMRPQASPASQSDRSVEPVEINVGKSGDIAQEKDQEENRQKLQWDVMHYLENHWNVPRENIYVEVQGE